MIADPVVKDGKQAEPQPVSNNAQEEHKSDSNGHNGNDYKPNQVAETEVRLVLEPANRDTQQITQANLLNIPHKEGAEGVKIADAPILNSVGQPTIRVQLTWENVFVVPKDDIQNTFCGYQKPTSEGRPKEPKKILKNVCGSVKPCEFLAIIGASGAGKTTLLNYLSNKMFPVDLHATGTTKINGIVREKLDYYKFTAFVQQDDILFETLTVEEVLEFAAALKCSADPDIRAAKVKEMLTELELVQVKDLRIGGIGGPVLSRGEKKRLSIAVELITNPALVFMDEPTTSMDTFTAEKIIDIINKLTLKGRTIIATIHQPNTEIYRRMDLLMLLSYGHVLYFGKANNAVDYFTSIGEPCPKNKNPAEFFMTMMTEEKVDVTKEQRLVPFVQAYEKSDMSKRHLEVAKNLTPFENCDISQLKYTASWCSQFCTLYKRSITNYRRNKMTASVRYMMQLYFSLIALALYFDLENNSQQGLMSRIGALYYCSSGIIMAAMQMSVLVFPEERAVFMREQASSLYDVEPYFFSKILAELPFSILDPIIMSLLTYWLIGFNTTDASKFFVFLFTLLAANMVSGAYSLFVGSFVSDREVLIILIPILTIPLSLLSGWFVRLDWSMTVLWPFQWVSVFKYAFNAVVRNEFYDNSGITVEDEVRMYNATTNTTTMRNVVIGSNDLLNGMEAKMEIWECFVAMAGLYIGFTILALIGLKVSSRRV